jgi:hypothetical protein
MDNFEETLKAFLSANEELARNGTNKALHVRSIAIYSPPEIADRGNVLLGIKLESGHSPIMFELPRKSLIEFAQSLSPQPKIP